MLSPPPHCLRGLPSSAGEGGGEKGTGLKVRSLNPEARGTQQTEQTIMNPIVARQIEDTLLCCDGFQWRVWVAIVLYRNYLVKEYNQAFV